MPELRKLIPHLRLKGAEHCKTKNRRLRFAAERMDVSIKARRRVNSVLRNVVAYNAYLGSDWCAAISI